MIPDMQIQMIPMDPVKVPERMEPAKAQVQKAPTQPEQAKEQVQAQAKKAMKA